MKRIIIIVFLILLLVGCGPPDTRTFKEKAQDSLLKELDDCDYKFGSQYEETRSANIAYCQKVLNMIDKLVRDECFDSELGLIVEEYNSSDMIKANKELDDLEQDIIGDI